MADAACEWAGGGGDDGSIDVLLAAVGVDAGREQQSGDHVFVHVVVRVDLGDGGERGEPKRVIRFLQSAGGGNVGGWGADGLHLLVQSERPGGEPGERVEADFSGRLWANHPSAGGPR